MNIQINLTATNKEIETLQSKLLAEYLRLEKDGAQDVSDHYKKISARLYQLQLNKASLELQKKSEEKKVWTAERISSPYRPESTLTVPDRASTPMPITRNVSIETPIMFEPPQEETPDLFGSWVLGFPTNFYEEPSEESAVSVPKLKNFSPRFYGNESNSTLPSRNISNESNSTPPSRNISEDKDGDRDSLWDIFELEKEQAMSY